MAISEYFTVPNTGAVCLNLCAFVPDAFVRDAFVLLLRLHLCVFGRGALVRKALC